MASSKKNPNHSPLEASISLPPPVGIVPEAQATEVFPSLANQLLVAMPGMLDGYFAGTVVLLCEHNERGALGVIINKPTDLKLNDLFNRIDIALHDPAIQNQPVFFGGPVQIERGFVLHSPAQKWSSTLAVDEQLGLTTSKDILEAVSQGAGPDQILVTLGYAGWGAGQLEQEIAQNAWLTVPVDPQLLFNLAPEQRFAAAFHVLGIDPAQISMQAGHA